MEQKPVIGILLGDSAGVGPEIVAKVSGSGFLTGHCRPVIIGDNRVYENAIRLLGEDAPHYCTGAVSGADWERGIPVLDQKNQNPADIKYGTASREAGRAVNEMIKAACGLCVSGDIAGFAFAPFNKAAMIDAGCPFESEHHLMADIFNVAGPFGEINVVDGLMTTRTTSHIPLKDVSKALTLEAILRAIRLSHLAVKSIGVVQPRIGIAALNPHGGENGHCGREELDVIVPAIQKAREEGMAAEGPYPADILFIKAFKGEFDSVVTMYHDQGQIALKLKGFERGITVAGGQPYPIATCAHGTAYDIAGKRTVSTTAFENAVKMVVKMANAKAAKTGENP
jgi:4-hydroxythreonine-4-phosphate dehydrogenase